MLIENKYVGTCTHKHCVYVMYMYIQVYTFSFITDLLVVICEHPDDCSQILPALGLALVATGMEVAGQSRRTQSQVPRDR